MSTIMGVKERRSRELGSFMYTCFILVSATVWSWIMTVPRAFTNAAMRVLDVFENAMLNMVWDYQGDNILRFLYEHQRADANRKSDGVIGKVRVDGRLLRAKISTSSRSFGMQTDDCTMSLGAREREKRDMLMDKILEDLVPALLEVLHSIPQRSEMEAIYKEQLGMVQNLQLAGNRKPLLLTLSDCEETSNSKDERCDIGSVLQGLAKRVGQVDGRVVQVLRALEGESKSNALVDERLAILVDGLGAVKEKCEADRALALHMMQCLERIDSTIASGIAAAESRIQLTDTREPHNNQATQKRQQHRRQQSEHDGYCGDGYCSSFFSAMVPDMYSGSIIADSACSINSNSENDNSDDDGQPISRLADNVFSTSNTRAQTTTASLSDKLEAKSEEHVSALKLKSTANKDNAMETTLDYTYKRDPSEVTLPRAKSAVIASAADYLYSIVQNEQQETHRTGLGISTKATDAETPKLQTIGRIRRKFSLRREIKRHSWFGKKPE
ncbi:hypothetical protein GGI25_004038 [Coemansia spiralis]|uniref:Uncharacterized protein n=2 Tax=Coemansia TaxID=4863 RepID=A0A9W8G5M2_9FUNG|nr:hypothetical protein GGI25_004038 [Coemansia spiralis]